MANTRSAIKRIRQTTTRALRNRQNRSRLRTQVRKLDRAVETKDASAAKELLQPTLSVVDKSVQKGVLKKNTASRMKSRLTLDVRALGKSEGSADS